MAKWTVGKGLDEYLAQLGNLEHMTPTIVGRSVYEGAKIVADQIHANIAALPTGRKSDRIPRNPTAVEKAGMLAGLGVARHQWDGSFYNVKIGMNGYNNDKTKMYPNGKPNSMIARSIESGSSVMIRNAFIARAIRSSKAAAEDAMRNECDKQISKTMGS